METLGPSDSKICKGKCFYLPFLTLGVELLRFELLLDFDSGMSSNLKPSLESILSLFNLSTCCLILFVVYAFVFAGKRKAKIDHIAQNVSTSSTQDLLGF